MFYSTGETTHVINHLLLKEYGNGKHPTNNLILNHTIRAVTNWSYSPNFCVYLYFNGWLHFYHKPDSIELDFLMRYHDECTVIECKATTGNAKSLKTVLKHPEKYHISHALKFGDYNVGRNGAILTLPFYMTYLI